MVSLKFVGDHSKTPKYILQWSSKERCLISFAPLDEDIIGPVGRSSHHDLRKKLTALQTFNK
jgi:hypothetical protein